MSPKKAPITADPNFIFYHIGQGARPFREAVASIPVNATDEQIAEVASTVSRLESAFPLPVTAGINAWYGNEFVAAYLAVRTSVHLKSMLTAMGDAGAADPGAVVLAWGAKYPALTVAEVEVKDPDYLDWILRQSGLDAYRITAAVGAYRLLRDRGEGGKSEQTTA